MAEIEERKLKPADKTQFERGREIARALAEKHYGIDLGMQSAEDVAYFILQAVNVDRRKGRSRRRLVSRRKQFRDKAYVRRQVPVDRRVSS